MENCLNWDINEMESIIGRRITYPEERAMVIVDGLMKEIQAILTRRKFDLLQQRAVFRRKIETVKMNEFAEQWEDATNELRG